MLTRFRRPLPTLTVPALLACLGLAACDGGAAYPRLLPTDSILAEPALPAHARGPAGPLDPAALEAAAAARASGLQQRARELQAPVIDPETRARMGRAGA